MFIDKCSNKCKISKSRKLKVYYVSTMIKGECSILLKCHHTECLIGHDTKILIFQSKCWNSHNPSKPYIDRYSIMQTHFYICLCLHWLRVGFNRYFFFQIDVKEITIISQFTEKIPPISWILMKTDSTIVASEEAFFSIRLSLSLSLKEYHVQYS